MWWRTKPSYGRSLFNLISNAVKFTHAGEVVLSAGVERQDETTCVISIEARDTGIGIATDRMPHLLLAFNQADSSINRRYGGTGLGLAISQSLVALMHGKIEVESAVDKGTRVRFTIVEGRSIAPATPRPAPSPAVSASRQLAVLVAEDNVVSRKLVQILLKKFGVSPTWRKTVPGYCAAMEKPYDLILMDIQMPEVNGLAATRAIRSRLPADTQPVIFGLTAHATTEYRDMCFEAGMNGFLTKPLELENFRNLIAKLSSQCSTRDFLSSLAKEPTVLDYKIR